MKINHAFKPTRPVGPQYYAARQSGESASARAALIGRGASADEAEVLIKSAEISGSLAIIMPLDFGSVVITEQAGRWIEWEACSAQLFDTPSEAAEFARELEQRLQADGEPASRWAVFQYVPSATMSTT